MEKNYSDFRKLNLFITWIAGICVCCFLNTYQPFMILWAGEEYLLSFDCVILMCIYFYLYVTNHLMATYKDAAGMWHEDRFRPFCSSMVNLFLNLFLANNSNMIPQAKYVHIVNQIECNKLLHMSIIFSVAKRLQLTKPFFAI